MKSLDKAAIAVMAVACASVAHADGAASNESGTGHARAGDPPLLATAGRVMFRPPAVST